jgi:diguanylate cyclase (GGDEF)-like protein
MSRQKKQTILVVDDEPLNLQVLSQALKGKYRIKAATSGADAIAVAHSDGPPDLILLDVRMPGMDGYQVCSQLKESDATREIPIIFITGKNASEDEAFGLELGAMDYITKPFSLPIVMARIRNQLMLKTKTDMLAELASIDCLTELANRRRFQEALDSEWRRALRNHDWLSIIMIDVDHFKQVNDQYGHAIGDVCLKTIADTLDQTVRRSADVLARYGGEEFVALIPELEPSAALALGEKMRSEVAAINWQEINERIARPITVSIGIGTRIPDPQSSPEELLAAADQCLYKAKDSGRNQVKTS